MEQHCHSVDYRFRPLTLQLDFLRHNKITGANAGGTRQLHVDAPGETPPRWAQTQRCWRLPCLMTAATCAICRAAK